MRWLLAAAAAAATTRALTPTQVRSPHLVDVVARAIHAYGIR